MVMWITQTDDCVMRYRCLLHVFHGTKKVLQAHRAAVRTQARYRGSKARQIGYLQMIVPGGQRCVATLTSGVDEADA